MIYIHSVVAAFYIYAQRDEDAAKTRGWRHGITLLFIENHEIVFLNSCGNPALKAVQRVHFSERSK